jgi:phosphate transport system ATP-binding protein
LLEAFHPTAPAMSQPVPEAPAAPETRVLKKRIVMPRARLPADDTRPSTPTQVKAAVERLDFWYGKKHALKDLNMTIADRRVTALIGPSGCGKSTFLRCFNRMHDLQIGTRYQGRIMLQPNPFPKSIFENVAYGLRLRGVRKHSEIEEAVEHALRSAALWEETKDRLQESALALSGGQMQRLCIARSLVTKPEILLFDEPTSALDPLATAKIEELISTLRDEVTVLIVTHNMQQAARVSDYTAFMFLGELVEFGDTGQIFTNPKQKATEDYITGRYG